MPRIAIYARVSTADQHPEIQLDALRAYAEARSPKSQKCTLMWRFPGRNRSGRASYPAARMQPPRLKYCASIN